MLRYYGRLVRHVVEGDGACGPGLAGTHRAHGNPHFAVLIEQLHIAVRVVVLDQFEDNRHELNYEDLNLVCQRVAKPVIAFNYIAEFEDFEGVEAEERKTHVEEHNFKILDIVIQYLNDLSWLRRNELKQGAGDPEVEHEEYKTDAQESRAFPCLCVLETIVEGH